MPHNFVFSSPTCASGKKYDVTWPVEKKRIGESSKELFFIDKKEMFVLKSLTFLQVQQLV